MATAHREVQEWRDLQAAPFLYSLPWQSLGRLWGTHLQLGQGG